MKPIDRACSRRCRSVINRDSQFRDRHLSRFRHTLRLTPRRAGRGSSLLAAPATRGLCKPEQVRNEARTTSSDVYSLVVILCVLLTGHHRHKSEHTGPHDLMPSPRKRFERIPWKKPISLQACPKLMRLSGLPSLAKHADLGFPVPRDSQIGKRRGSPTGIARAHSWRQNA
jgi:hypothetical protein